MKDCVLGYIIDGCASSGFDSEVVSLSSIT